MILAARDMQAGGVGCGDAVDTVDVALASMQATRYM